MSIIFQKLFEFYKFVRKICAVRSSRSVASPEKSGEQELIAFFAMYHAPGAFVASPSGFFLRPTVCTSSITSDDTVTVTSE